jgi:predicted ATPase/transcriptional regulator with XRE-family HTH domain
LDELAGCQGLRKRLAVSRGVFLGGFPIEAPVSFGGYIRRRRKALDKTQEELANCVGCSVATIQKIERDERRPSRQIAELLANCLDIPDQDRPNFLKVARAERSIEQLASPLAQIQAPPVTVYPIPGTNLPASFTPIIGREPELAELAQLLLQPGCQLLSLLGPGGIGKTRLAVEIAHRFYAQQPPLFPDGIYFVQLATIESADLIVPAIADALAITFSGPGDPVVQLLNSLRNKRLFLLLDNLEHLLEGGQLISEILLHSPGVKIMATSRERLNLHGEWIFEIQGLPVPPPDHYVAIESYSSVALFIQSARRSRPQFHLDENNQAYIARICRSLDGMPLGIEMAAAWIRVLSPREIAEEIDDNLDFLTAPARNLPERHRSLRAVFDHSWKLLTEEEKRSLRQMSVFRGDFDREAARQVAGIDLAVLSSLVDKSLLERAGDGRYRLHELIHQYAYSHLLQDPQEHVDSRERHTCYYLSWLQASEELIKDERQNEALFGFILDLDDIRWAWDWAVQEHYLHEQRQAAHPLMLCLELRNSFHEGEAFFRLAVDKARSYVAKPGTDEALKEILLGEMLSSLGWFTFRLGNVDEAFEYIREANTLLRKHNQAVSLAINLWHYANVCWFAGLFDEATQAVTEAMEIYRSLGHKWGIANMIIYLGVFALEQGDYEKAYQLLRDGLSQARICGDPRLISFAVIYLDRTPQAQARYDEMKSLHEEILDYAIQTRNRYGKGVVLERMALAEQAAGNIERARQLLSESILLFKEIEDLWSYTRVLTYMGRLAFSEGDQKQAMQVYDQALRSAVKAHLYPNALDALTGLAEVFFAAGKNELALEITAHILNHPAATRAARQTAEKLLGENEHGAASQVEGQPYGRFQAKTLEDIMQEISSL